jgi:hypothetical protein
MANNPSIRISFRILHTWPGLLHTLKIQNKPLGRVSDLGNQSIVYDRKLKDFYPVIKDMICLYSERHVHVRVAHLIFTCVACALKFMKFPQTNEIFQNKVFSSI